MPKNIIRIFFFNVFLAQLGIGIEETKAISLERAILLQRHWGRDEEQ
jgi:hypothetical protein